MPRPTSSRDESSQQAGSALGMRHATTAVARGCDASSILRAAAVTARRRCPSLDVEEAIEALRRREQELPTHLGGGVAMPHAVLEGLDAPTIVDVDVPSGVRWGDGSTVRRAFVVLVPTSLRSRSLECVAAAARVVARATGTGHRAVATADEPASAGLDAA